MCRTLAHTDCFCTKEGQAANSSSPYIADGLSQPIAAAPTGGGTGVERNKPIVDLDAVGQFEGKDIYDVDIDSLEDKPWRRPGADLSDYFNFGFNEQTWRLYVQKQKRLRDEMGGIVTPSSTLLNRNPVSMKKCLSSALWSNHLCPSAVGV